MVEKSGKILPLSSEIHCFLAGVFQCSTGKTRNLHHSALILPNQGSCITNKSGGVQISFLSGA